MAPRRRPEPGSLSARQSSDRQLLRFKQIRLLNWKNFRDVTVVTPDRLFLVGPNASGKSNFLDAFRFLRDLASPEGGLQSAVRTRGGVSAIRCLSARRYPAVELHVVVETRDSSQQWEYELGFTQDKQRNVHLTRERVMRDGKVIVERPNPEDKEDAARLAQTYLEQVNTNREFRVLANFFASVRYLHIVPQLVREPERSVGRSNDPFGGDFLEQVAKTPERTRKSRLTRIGNALKIAVPQFSQIELFRDERGIPHLRGKYRHWRPEGAWQQENQFSDGTLRLLGLLWALQEGGGPLLLEEPELSLNQAIVRHLPQMFAHVQQKRRRQIFVSTHSAELINDEGVGLNEVVILRPTEEGTDAPVAESHEEIQSLVDGGMPLGEAVFPYIAPRKIDDLVLFGD